MSQIRGSWLSLFAMLMIFIGPLISQAMPMDHHASMPMPMDMRVSAHSEHAEPQQPSADHHAMWEKCGYCTLLFSCPALPARLTWPCSIPLNPKVIWRPTPGWATPGNRSSPAPDLARRPPSFKHRHNNFTLARLMPCPRQARGRVVLA